MHLYRAHGVRRRARRFCADGRCPACGWDYGTRLRCIDHMHHRSARCLAWLDAQEEPLIPEDEALRLDAADALERL
eukprot:10736152-Lingulodinium_polyedra.AAC.1